jgi:hypothetical protein
MYGGAVCRSMLLLLQLPTYLAKISPTSKSSMEASMLREYGGGRPKAHDLRPCTHVRVCGSRDKTSVTGLVYAPRVSKHAGIHEIVICVATRLHAMLPATTRP